MASRGNWTGASGGFELRHRLDEGKPSTNRALRIMLVSLRITEVRENAVAHVLGNEAAIAFDHFRAAAVIGGEPLKGAKMRFVMLHASRRDAIRRGCSLR